MTPASPPFFLLRSVPWASSSFSMCFGKGLLSPKRIWSTYIIHSLIFIVSLILILYLLLKASHSDFSVKLFKWVHLRFLNFKRMFIFLNFKHLYLCFLVADTEHVHQTSPTSNTRLVNVARLSILFDFNDLVIVSVNLVSRFLSHGLVYKISPQWMAASRRKRISLTVLSSSQPALNLHGDYVDIKHVHIAQGFCFT